MKASIFAALLIQKAAAAAAAGPYANYSSSTTSSESIRTSITITDSSISSSSATPSSAASSSDASKSSSAESSGVVAPSSSAASSTGSSKVSSAGSSSPAPSSSAPVNNDLNAAARSAGSIAVELASSVAAWHSSDGINGLLGIQSEFPELFTAVDAVADQAQLLANPAVQKRAAEDSVDPDSINSFAASVTELLNKLTEKAADITANDAQPIFKGDINHLSGPSEDIINDIIKIVSSDCAKLDSMTASISAFEAAFTSAANAFSASVPSFNPATCAIVDSSANPSSSSLPTKSITITASSTTIVYGDKTYTVSDATTLTVSDCSCSDNSKISGVATGPHGTVTKQGTTAVTQDHTAYVTIPCESTTLTYGGKTYPVSDKTTLTVMDCSCIDNSVVPTMPAGASPAAKADTTVTKQETNYVTIPCESTTLTYGGNTYTVSEETTLTVSDCSCTDNSVVPTYPAAFTAPTKPESSNPAGALPAVPKPAAASPVAPKPSASAVASAPQPNGPMPASGSVAHSAPAVANAGTKAMVSIPAAIAGAVLMLL